MEMYVAMLAAAGAGIKAAAPVILALGMGSTAILALWMTWETVLAPLGDAAFGDDET